MIGRINERRGHWMQALVISLALHGVAAAPMLDVLPGLPRPAANQPLPEIDIVSLPVEQATHAPVELGPALSPSTLEPAPIATPGNGAETIAPVTPDAPTDQVAQPVLTPAEDMQQATTVQPDPGTSTATGTPGEIAIAALPPDAVPPGTGDPTGAGAGSPAQNAAIADLVQRLRDRLAQPCLAALPQTIGGEEVLLTVLGAVDRDISDLFREVAGDVAVPMTERSVLLDARQCPAVDFARASATYPALPLAIQLEAAEVASDDHLIGRVDGVGGNQVAFLMIDDNGVVQDLRRFAEQSGDALNFDVPVFRVGGDRDTSQLLMAVALPELPDSVTAMDGALAADFFPPLTAAAQGRALIGATPVYVRAAAP